MTELERLTARAQRDADRRQRAYCIYNLNPIGRATLVIREPGGREPLVTVEPRPAFTATGNHGEATYHAETGELLHATDCQECADGCTGYADLVRADVEEWRRYYPGEELVGQEVDILDVATWDKDGGYAAAEEDFRAECRRQHAEG